MPLRGPQCVICGDRLRSAQLLMGDGQCANCRECPPVFERAVSFGEYENGLRGLIHLLKYERVTPACEPLGDMLAEAICELLPSSTQASTLRLRSGQATDAFPGDPGCDVGKPVLVSVPLHRNRRSSRGFNQAELLARGAMKRLPGELEFAPEALIRQRETISQVGLSRDERIENMRGAFRVADARRVRGRNVIVVDDVMTTGTTLSECARVLKKAGAEKVWAATAARVFHGADVANAADTGIEEEVEADVGPTHARAALVGGPALASR